ncbi:hypothetical protein [Klebsiella pneumoniae]|uniref:hypothetical protein n=1 Tax=Klebsiella pneumoniae TaxID=573 RepID=UPI001CF67C82|nr:hypothetical protein [Klebsiella pneumoniae]
MSEKFQTVSFDLYSSVMGITGLGLVWRAAAKTYDVSALPGEVFLATLTIWGVVTAGVSARKATTGIRNSLRPTVNHSRNNVPGLH